MKNPANKQTDTRRWLQYPAFCGIKITMKPVMVTKKTFLKSIQKLCVLTKPASRAWLLIKFHHFNRDAAKHLYPLDKLFFYTVCHKSVWISPHTPCWTSSDKKVHGPARRNLHQAQLGQKRWCDKHIKGDAMRPRATYFWCSASANAKKTQPRNCYVLGKNHPSKTIRRT